MKGRRLKFPIESWSKRKKIQPNTKGNQKSSKMKNKVKSVGDLNEGKPRKKRTTYKLED